ncbi:30S ribosomal protein S18 [Patescibacteria group bacterium]|nr:30S ribosomal protein S18 [Patescibacteria group bacterium]MBU2580073.1 30S ribosomal protein S18 [Patescibacteria group bacterium]MBU4030804.1 30S ribosomal protein S18 [Patescibacteria group bacterium]MBU4082550.1 30S ribosomal protein S18 [Patescibacteria group bacterium]MCG2808731.1 30S ribosomal protein S18 [Candidatus Portnoybacteria bacterium]
MIKNCPFCQEKDLEINYQDTETLFRFTSGQAKIITPKRTGVCAKHQRQLAKAIKRARVMGLMPFIRK